MNLTHRPARGSGSFEFAWKIVSTFPTYDMFSSLTLLSLLAALLTQISIRQHQSDPLCFNSRWSHTWTDWQPAMSCQLAISHISCLLTAVYKGGVPPGLHLVALVQLLRYLSQANTATRTVIAQSSIEI